MSDVLSVDHLTVDQLEAHRVTLNRRLEISASKFGPGSAAVKETLAALDSLDKVLARRRGSDDTTAASSPPNRPSGSSSAAVGSPGLGTREPATGGERPGGGTPAVDHAGGPMSVRELAYRAQAAVADPERWPTVEPALTAERVALLAEVAMLAAALVRWSRNPGGIADKPRSPIRDLTDRLADLDRAMSE